MASAITAKLAWVSTSMVPATTLLSVLITGNASSSATAMGYTAWLSRRSGDESAFRSTMSATMIASIDGPMSDFHAPSGSGRRVCSLEMTGSQVSPKMKQVMHAPTRGIHNMARALRSRAR